MGKKNKQAFFFFLFFLSLRHVQSLLSALPSLLQYFTPEEYVHQLTGYKIITIPNYFIMIRHIFPS